MSLTFALGMATRGLMSTDNKIGLTTQNITNADKAGYSRKTTQDRYITTNGGTYPIGGAIVGSTDRFLTQGIVDDVNISSMRQVISDALENLSRQMGSTAGTNTLSSYMNDMYAALQQVSSSPEIAANKATVVFIANNLANALRNFSVDTQNERLQANLDMKTSVDAINTSLGRLEELNHKILEAPNVGFDIAEFEDQRLAELETLSSQLDIQYFFDSQNQLQVFTTGGQPLLLSQALQISYTPQSHVDSSMVYPAGFNPVLLNGVDITTQIQGGKLGGFIDLRDNILTDVQAKFDEFAIQLADNLNSVVNSGTAMPPRNSMTGSTQGLTAATAHGGAGIFRVAVLDRAGVVQSFADINLAANPTVGNVITALNAVAGVTASLNANGELVITAAPATSGIALNEMTSAIGAPAKGFSDFFGMSDLFTYTAGAEDINVASYLITNTDALAAGALANGALAVGQQGAYIGDGTVAEALKDRMAANVNFNAAGSFGAQSNTLMRYGESIMSDVANTASLAQTEYDVSYAVYQESKTYLDNYIGVNIDEETARLIELQSKYQASAKMITVVRDLFQELLNAVR